MRRTLYGCIPLYLLLLAGCQGDSQQTIGTQGSRIVFDEPRELHLDLVAEIHPQNEWPVEVEMDRLIVLDEASVFVTGFNVSTTWRIDLSGDMLGSFGRRGQGPGEFQFALSGKRLGDELWLSSAQVFAAFSLEGSVLHHFQIRQFPTSWDLDEDRIVAEVLHIDDGGSMVASLESFDKEGVKQSVLVSAAATGSVPVKAGKFISNVDLGHGVLPRSLFAVDAHRHVVYVANSGTYTVTAMGLDGTTRWVFTPHANIEGQPVTADVAKALVENYTSRISVQGESDSEFREKIERLVPDRLCPIHSMAVTPGGLLLVGRQRAYEDLVYDVIQPDGTLLETIDVPSSLRNTLTMIQMYGDRVAELVVPESKDEEAFVRVFRIRNAPSGW